MVRVLCFEQITDERFNDNIRELLEERVATIKKLLSIDGVNVQIDSIRNIDFGTNKQCRCKFYVSKSTRKVTWNDIYTLVNSVCPVPYNFISTTKPIA